MSKDLPWMGVYVDRGTPRQWVLVDVQRNWKKDEKGTRRTGSLGVNIYPHWNDSPL